MRRRGRIHYTWKAISVSACILLLPLCNSVVSAAVSGSCVLCHTMHNSQAGAPQAATGTIGSFAAWNNSNVLTGSVDTANAVLLKTDCVGCHSSTSDQTIVDMNGSGSKVPIVFNTTGVYPSNPLAGGNFALNQGSADIYGHNVAGISYPDSDLLFAPGLSFGCTGCHQSLAIGVPSQPALPRILSNGCEGCHQKPAHHSPSSSDPTYRYLGGHNLVDNVLGIEDTDWEATKSNTDHNVYARHDAGTENGDVSMGRFCAGCHQNFHSTGGTNQFGVANGGDDNQDNTAGDNPWLRHPNNVNIPDDGEYAELFLPANNAYNPDIPVAQELGVNNDIVNSGPTGDQVMCLTCHRAHASDQPDALRFDYTAPSHSGSGNFTGCFYCHREKDTEGRLPESHV